MRWVAPTEKDTANQTLEKRLWEAADQFRANSGLKAGEYSGPVLGLIFLRFAEARFAQRRAQLEKAGASARRGTSRIDDPKAYQAEGVLFLTPNSRFDYLLQRPEGSNVGKAVNEAMADIEKPLYGAVKPDPVAVEFATRCGSIRALADYIRNRTDPPDISHVMQDIQELLDRSIGAEPFKIKDKGIGYAGIDLSKIDFEKLAKRFEKTKPTSSDLERLKAAVKAQLERMVRLNRTRADYLEKFEALIEAYNSGSRNIDEIFRDLIALSRVLTDEQNRHVREHLSEEELTVFDILTRPGPDLSTEERNEVKKVAQQLLSRLHELLVLGWRQKIQSRAKVRLAIEDALDDGLPRAYTKELYAAKCNSLFEHVFEAYQGEGKSVYAATA